MINNIELIKPLLIFEELDFYQLYIFLRKKDQGDVKCNHQSVRTIKSYSIPSIKHLEDRMDEIIGLSEFFKARVYISINKCNHKDISLSILEQLAKRIRAGSHNQRNLFDSVAGKESSSNRWVVDIDTKDYGYIEEVSTYIGICRPEGNKIISTIPTKNGVHLITSRFDLSQFKSKYEEIDVQKCNPTLLYYPSSLP